MYKGFLGNISYIKGLKDILILLGVSTIFVFFDMFLWYCIAIGVHSLGMVSLIESIVSVLLCCFVCFKTLICSFYISGLISQKCFHSKPQAE